MEDIVKVAIARVCPVCSFSVSLNGQDGRTSERNTINSSYASGKDPDAIFYVLKQNNFGKRLPHPRAEKRAKRRNIPEGDSLSTIGGCDEKPCG
jgi:hypothetical protein